MSAHQNESVLVISTVDSYTTRRLLPHIRSQYQHARITLLAPVAFSESFSKDDYVDDVWTYETRGNIFATAIGLLRRLRREQHDACLILCHNASQRGHLRDVILFSFLIRCRRRALLDQNLVLMDLHALDSIVAVLQRFVVVLGVVLAKMLTLFIVSISLGLLHFSHDPYRKITGRRGQIAIVLPIIPDLSHTFIYREVLAMQKHGAQFKVISLAEGDYGVVHPEARSLLPEVVFVPKISQVEYLLLYLYMLIRHPINMSRLLSFYKSCGFGDIFLFADPNNLYNSPHPCRGLLLARTLQKHDVSYMHVYGSMYPATQALVASILLGIPFSISTFVDFESEYDFKMLRQKCEFASFVVVVTQFCVTRILRLASQQVGGKLHVIYHGIDPSYANNPPDRDSRREKLSVIAVGRFVEKKGFEYLVKACAVLRDRGIIVTCSIVGGGPERGQLQSLIRKLELGDIVRLLEPVPNDKLRDLISSSCILVAPSVYSHDGERDGIPIVLLEAMCLGTAVIATRISGIPELVTHSADGLLVPERDEHAIADAMQQLLTDSDLRRRLSVKACEKVLRDFTTDAGAKNLRSLIQAETVIVDHIRRGSKSLQILFFQ